MSLCRPRSCYFLVALDRLSPVKTYTWTAVSPECGFSQVSVVISRLRLQSPNDKVSMTSDNWPHANHTCHFRCFGRSHQPQADSCAVLAICQGAAAQGHADRRGGPDEIHERGVA